MKGTGLQRREERKSWGLELLVSGFMASSVRVSDAGRGLQRGCQPPEPGFAPGFRAVGKRAAGGPLAPEVTRGVSLSRRLQRVRRGETEGSLRTGGTPGGAKNTTARDAPSSRALRC